MGGMLHLTLFSLLTAVISLSQFFSFYWKSWKHYRRVFILLFEQMGMQKKNCGTLPPFTALQVNPTMTTSATEKPGNVKKVHYIYTNWNWLTDAKTFSRWYSLMRSETGSYRGYIDRNMPQNRQKSEYSTSYQVKAVHTPLPARRARLRFLADWWSRRDAAWSGWCHWLTWCSRPHWADRSWDTLKCNSIM